VDTTQRLKAVLNSIDDAILMVDSNLKVVMCNKRFENFFGIPPSTIIGQNKKEAITREIKWRVRHPEDFQKKLFWLYNNPEVVEHDEIEVVIPRRRILHRFSGPVYDNDNYLLGRVEVYSDITQKKDLQQELEAKNAQLFLLNAAATSITQSLKLYTLGQTFLRRISQASNAKAGILYSKAEENKYKLVSTFGNFNNPQEIPRFINNNFPKKVFWGHIKEKSSFDFLENILEKGFFVAFQAFNAKEDSNGLCILLWDQLNEKILDHQLFENIGFQLGIGISNALLYKESRRNAILQERDRIAMEMHDSLAQTLGYLGLGIDSVINRFNNSQYSECLELLKQLRKVIDRSYSDVREAIIGLRVDFSKDVDFIKALTNYIKEFNKLSNITVNLNTKGNYYPIDFESQLHIIRVVQEALTNVRRHANATCTDINIVFNNNDLNITVEDNGRGFDLKSTDKLSSLHQGLKIMKQRARTLGGTLNITTAQGKGTKTELIVPLRKGLGE